MDGAMEKDLIYKWIDKYQLWDCTDGEIHGGGKTKEEAKEDYKKESWEDYKDRAWY